MIVIVEKPFGRHGKGAVLSDMPANQARALIARGLVREHVADKAMAAPVNRMMRASSARKSVSR